MDTPPNEMCPIDADFISFYSKDKETPETKTHLFSILSNDVLNAIINEKPLQELVDLPPIILSNFLLKKVNGEILIIIQQDFSILTIIGEKASDPIEVDDVKEIESFFNIFKKYFVFIINNNQELLDYLDSDNYILIDFEYRDHKFNKNIIDYIDSSILFHVDFHEDKIHGKEFSYTCLTYLESEKTTDLGLLNVPLDFFVENIEKLQEKDVHCHSVRFDATNPNTTLWFNNQKIIHRVPTNAQDATYTGENDIKTDITPIVNVLGQRTDINHNSKRRLFVVRFSNYVLNHELIIDENEILHKILPDELVTNKPYKIQVYNDKIDEYFNNHKYTDDNGKTVLQIGKFFVAGKQGKTKTRRRRKAGTRKKTKKRNKQTP